jgi:hypothetical protein
MKSLCLKTHLRQVDVDNVLVVFKVSLEEFFIDEPEFNLSLALNVHGHRDLQLEDVRF